MKKQALKIFTTVSLLTTLVVASVYANPDGRIWVNIPFAFTVGEKTLPAGQYTIEHNPVIRGSLIVRSADCRASVTGLTMNVYSQTIQTQAKLVFHRYGNQYFLAQAWRSGLDVGEEFPKSRAERKAAKGASDRLAKTDAKPEVVYIAGQ